MLEINVVTYARKLEGFTLSVAHDGKQLIIIYNYVLVVFIDGSCVDDFDHIERFGAYSLDPMGH